MRHASYIKALFLLKRSENKKLALLWNQAEPISLDELKAKFAALVRDELAYQPDQAIPNVDSFTLEELWVIFESLEELEDYPLIY
jgi:hypothetical protein